MNFHEGKYEYSERECHGSIGENESEFVEARDKVRERDGKNYDPYTDRNRHDPTEREPPPIA